jgi:hypothetical protein
VSETRTLRTIRVIGDAEDLSIEGDAGSLRELADALAVADVLTVSYEDGSGRIDIARAEGKLRIGYQPPNAMTLRGDAKSLDLLAQNVRFTADGPQQPSGVQYHSHIDYFPNHAWLAEDAVPLTIWLAD